MKLMAHPRYATPLPKPPTTLAAAAVRFAYPAACLVVLVAVLAVLWFAISVFGAPV